MPAPRSLVTTLAVSLAVALAVALAATAPLPSAAGPASPAEVAPQAVTAVFTGMPSPPVACVTKGNGQRWCTGTSTRVQSFDKTPIDVSVFLPAAPASGPDGDYPLVGIYHGWGGTKAGSASASRWLAAGYAVFSMTDRGWYESCGTAASRQNLPAWASCDAGTINFIDYRYEVRDAQYLMGHLVDEGLVDPTRIGAYGGSYGGLLSSTLATLNNRIVTGVDAQGKPIYRAWRSPAGTRLRIAGAAPAALGSDLTYTQQPNGSTLDYVTDSPYFAPNGDARVGVQKAGVMNGFLDNVGPRGTLSPDAEGWQALANGPGPYDGLKPLLTGLLATHGAYNVDDSTAPAPMLISDGWNDDFVGVDEAVKLYNKIRSKRPANALAMYFGDTGHPRSQDKDADNLEPLRLAWMDYYVRDARVGVAPPKDVRMNGFVCGAGSGPASTIATWADASAGEIRLSSDTPKTVMATGTQWGEDFFGKDTTACAAVDATDNPKTANYRTAPAAGNGYTVRGGAVVLMRLSVSGPSDQLAVRLLDVDPETNKQILIERGLLRPEVGASEATQYLQLHPTMWRVAPGHRLKLELLPEDGPYSHINSATDGDAAAQHAIVVQQVQLRVPTIESAGAAGGQVKAPLARYLPPGFTLAPGY